MTGMEAFFTRQAANEGVEIPLYLPSGEKSEHTLRVRGVDSDEFRLAEADSKRTIMDVAMLDDPRKRNEAIADAKLRLIASLVLSWSFDRPCTPEEVFQFLREAPQIADAIDRVASKRALFFVKRSSNSDASPSTSSSST